MVVISFSKDCFWLLTTLNKSKKINSHFTTLTKSKKINSEFAVFKQIKLSFC